jgi:DNA topoisomerase-1
VVKNFYKPFHQKVEDAADISREETHGMRELGTDPKSGKPVSVRFGRYGAFAQIGHKDDEEKPVFASLRGSLDIETIKLEEALELFNMPRTVGETDDFGIIKANYGRFGPYIQYGKKYVSLKEITPEEVTLNEALTLIKAKEKFDAERIIKTFDDSVYF